MNEYQCPYCLHGDAEKERLLSHLLNCHSGRPGKVLLRKQITSSAGGAVSNTTDFSSPPPPPDGGSKPDRRFSAKSEIKSSDKKTEEGISSSVLPVYAKEVHQVLNYYLNISICLYIFKILIIITILIHNCCTFLLLIVEFVLLIVEFPLFELRSSKRLVQLPYESTHLRK